MRRLWMVILLLLGLLGLLGLAVGYWTGNAKDVVVPLNQVPEELARIAREKLPEVNFDHAVRRANGDYEIRGKARNGKIREVELKPDGEVVEIE